MKDVCKITATRENFTVTATCSSDADQLEFCVDIPRDVTRQQRIEIILDLIPEICASLEKRFVPSVLAPAPQPDPGKERARKELWGKLNKKVSELEFSIRSTNRLANANIELVGELVQKTEGDLLKLKYFGHTSLKEIMDALSSIGLTLGMRAKKLDGWRPPEEDEEDK